MPKILSRLPVITIASMFAVIQIASVVSGGAVYAQSDKHNNSGQSTKHTSNTADSAEPESNPKHEKDSKKSTPTQQSSPQQHSSQTAAKSYQPSKPVYASTHPTTTVQYNMPSTPKKPVVEHSQKRSSHTTQPEKTQPVPSTSTPTSTKRVSLCHATGSTTNPYVLITVSAAGAFNGHLGAGHQHGEDIIPPFVFHGQTYSQNWDTKGQALYVKGCLGSDTNNGGVIPIITKRVSLCHATGSTTNPYVLITVSAAGAFNGHLGAGHQHGEDIIPPFVFHGQTYSQNWDTKGQALYKNGCVQPEGGKGSGPVIPENTTPVPVIKQVNTNFPTGGMGAGSMTVASVSTPVDKSLSELANTGSNILLNLVVALFLVGATYATKYLDFSQKA